MSVMNKIFCIVSVALLLSGCSGREDIRSSEERSVEILLETAGVLKQRGFYAEAVEIYRDVLRRGIVTDEELGNVACLLAELELEQMNDPERAYAHYLLAEKLVANQDTMQMISKGKVAALERSGRSVAATEALQEATDLIRKEKKSGGEGPVVATIGDRKIHQSEVKHAFDRLPESLKKEFGGEEGFSDYLRQYVASEVLLKAAERAGLDRDPQVQERLSLMRREVLKNAYMERELAGKLTVGDLEARRYYRDNQDLFRTGQDSLKPYEEVREFCLNAARAQKQSQLTGTLIQRLFQASDVEFTDSK